MTITGVVPDERRFLREACQRPPQEEEDQLPEPHGGKVGVDAKADASDNTGAERTYERPLSMKAELSPSTGRWSVLLGSALCSLPLAHGELVVNSSDGYQVHIYVQLTHVVPNTMNCPWGYNWDVGLNFNVWFTGSNIPASLYTLQGTVGCGSTNLFFDMPNSGGDGSVVTTSNAYRSQSDCATVDLGTLGCHSTTIQIQGPGIDPQNIAYDPDLLPIELISFNATEENEHVRLDWATATELDNDHFTIERSQDGLNFQPVATIPGAGNSQQTITYSRLDRLVPEGLLYYRLKQTDVNGAYSYSPVVSVMTSLDPIPVVVPNPCTTDFFWIDGDVLGKQLEIRSATGELLRSLPIISRMIPHGGLPAGVYLLSIIDPSTGRTRALKLVRA